MKKNCIITSASNKFFPSLLNLLGSIEKNYPNHPDVYVYNLGLFFTFKKELQKIPWIHILEIPNFVSHWRSCYTWKTYILNKPLSKNNLYIDAGCQILKSLDDLFEKIESQNYLAVSQGSDVNLRDITPKDYIQIYRLDNHTLKQQVITAGIFGFKDNSTIKDVTEELYISGLNKLCLGFSSSELWKNKGINKNDYIRDCKIFRHDTTLISILLRTKISNINVEPINLFSSKLESSEQYIWNFRLNYKNLNFVKYNILNKKFNLYGIINRIFVYIFIFIKKITNNIKQKCFHF